jgi:hypothetical protein
MLNGNNNSTIVSVPLGGVLVLLQPSPATAFVSTAPATTTVVEEKEVEEEEVAESSI